MNKNKGITLIALVITIMIMVILASVAINLGTGENGVTQRSENARLESLRAQVLDMIQNETKTAINEFGEYSQILAINNLLENYDETKIAQLIVETNGRLGITFQEQGYEFKYFVSNRGEVTSVSEYVYEKENATYAIKSRIGSEEKSAYDLLAPVPIGFVASKIGAEITPEEFTADEYDGMVDVTLIDVDGNSVSDKYYFGEDKIEHGLVIYEGKEEVYNLNEEELKKVQEERNQFVWIPVKEDDLNSLLVVDEKNGDLYYIKKRSYAVTVDNADKVKEAKKRSIVEPYFDYELVTMESNKDNEKEVEFLKDLLKDDLNNEKLMNEFNVILRKDFNNMINSIKKYGGFYVSRDFSINIKGVNWLNFWKIQNNRNKENVYYNNERFYTNTIYQTQYELIKKFTHKTVFLNSNNIYKYFYSNYGIEPKYISYVNSNTDLTMVKNIKNLNYKHLTITQGMMVDNSEFEGDFEINEKNELIFDGKVLNFNYNLSSEFKIEESVVLKENGDFEIDNLNYKVPYTSTYFASTSGIINNTWAVVDRVKGNINFEKEEITGKIFLKFYNDQTKGSDDLNMTTILKEMTKDFSGTIDLKNKKFFGETNYAFINVVYAGGKNSHKAGMNEIRIRHSWMGYSEASSRMTLYMK